MCVSDLVLTLVTKTEVAGYAIPGRESIRKGTLSVYVVVSPTDVSDQVLPSRYLGPRYVILPAALRGGLHY